MSNFLKFFGKLENKNFGKKKRRGNQKENREEQMNAFLGFVMLRT